MNSCRCNCGYTCGGPGACVLFGKNPIMCMEEHYKFDCDHKWGEPWVLVSVYGCDDESETCSVCKAIKVFHDLNVGL